MLPTVTVFTLFILGYAESVIHILTHILLTYLISEYESAEMGGNSSTTFYIASSHLIDSVLFTGAALKFVCKAENIWSLSPTVSCSFLSTSLLLFRLCSCHRAGFPMSQSLSHTDTPLTFSLLTSWGHLYSYLRDVRGSSHQHTLGSCLQFALKCRG